MRCSNAVVDPRYTLNRMCKLTTTEKGNGTLCPIRLCETEEYKNCDRIKREIS